MSIDNYKIFSLISRIEGMSNQFTKTDWKIVQFLKSHTTEFVQLNAQDIASKIHTSDASIIRFSQKIGYSGLNELKYSIQTEMDKNSTEENKTDFSILINDNKALIDSLFHMTDPRSITTLNKHLTKSKRTFVVGLDFNRSIADMITHKFLLLGLSVQSVTTLDMLKLYSMSTTSEDLFIVVSFSGANKNLSIIMSELKDQGSINVLISNYEKSLCGAYSDLTLLVPKTDLLKSSNSISREITILILFDLIFQNMLFSNSKAYETFLRTSTYAKEHEESSLSYVDKLKDLL